MSDVSERYFDQVDWLGDLPTDRPDEVEANPFHVEQNGSAPTGRAWRPLDLVGLGSTPPQAPEIAGLFYLGKRHNLAGESEAAKTWLALAAAADELKARRAVVWVDGDLVGPSDLLERLRCFGVDDEAIRSWFRYFAPEGPLGDPSELVEPLGEGRLAVLDGWNPLLYLHGHDPDKGTGIEAFMRGIANPLREAGAAVVMTDNVSKNKDARGNWAIGSERKKSAVEVQFGMTTIEPLLRGHTGRFKLTVHKDRPGFHERPSPGLFVVTSDPDSGRCSWKIDAETSAEGEGFRPTRLMEKVSRYLEQRVEPCSRNQVEQNVAGKTDYKRQAINVLIEEGYAIEVPDGKSRLLKSAVPFREVEES